MEVDLEKLKEGGKPTVTPIIITNMDKVEKIEKNSGKVEGGNNSIFTVYLK